MVRERWTGKVVQDVQVLGETRGAVPVYVLWKTECEVCPVAEVVCDSEESLETIVEDDEDMLSSEREGDCCVETAAGLGDHEESRENWSGSADLV